VEWLLRHGANDAQILETVAAIRLGNFFPAVDWQTMEYALPLPMSAASCKRSGGFASEPLPRYQGHGVVDTLLPLLAYRLMERAGAQFTAPFALTCAKCGDRMEPIGGFYAAYQRGQHRHYAQFRPRYHAQTKVGMSRHRRASAEQMLYTASALSPRTPGLNEEGEETGLVLLGRVHGDEQAVQRLKEALSHMAVGALHTRGYGRVEVQGAEVRLHPLKDRLKAFNDALARLWEDIRRLAANAHEVPQTPNGTYFSVDLLSPGVFQKGGVPSLVPTLTIAGRKVEPTFWMTRPDMASGWSTAWGLPKPTNLAARMGSVYVFHWAGPEADLFPALQALEAEGVGERRDESYGECLICHPFHQEVEER